MMNETPTNANRKRKLDQDETQISDRNIHYLVKQYIETKDKLPNDLKEKQIGDWNVSEVTDMTRLFADCVNFNEPLHNWDVSKVKAMTSMFFDCKSFNHPLDNWVVSNVKNMFSMFSGCSDFNQPLNSWDVSNVENMESMFEECILFNQPLNNWDVRKVQTMNSMFEYCEVFNQPLNDWRVDNVTNMMNIFCGCKKFNQPLNEWNVSRVNDMFNMFFECEQFNQPLDEWDVGNVTVMSDMFNQCTSFNQPLNNWDVSNVTNMSNMFWDCTNFNQPLNNWNVSRVLDMSYMFFGCANFNQSLVGWDVRNVEENQNMFGNCRIQEQNKPIFHERAQEPAPMEVDAYQIHREAAKINYTKLNAFLKEKINTTVPTNINYPTYIKETLSHIIDTNNEPEATKTVQKNGLKRIMTERLNGVRYTDFSELQRNSIFYSLQYVLQQPAEFQKEYVDTFIKDCVHAYEGDDGMTCAAGALERFVISLVTACQSVLSTGNENEEYEQIVAIIIANPAKLIPEYIHDWYKLHKTGTENAFPSGTSTETKKEDLKTYLLGFFPEESELIDSNIVEIADNIGYDDDVFMYGGKKRKRLTKRKHPLKKNKITKSKKTKKTKKQSKTKKNSKTTKTKKTTKTTKTKKTTKTTKTKKTKKNN